MRDVELLQQALGAEWPWAVARAEFDAEARRLDIYLDFERGGTFTCPECGSGGCSAYDTAEKRWRHLNFCQHEAVFHARVPRVECGACGVKQVEVLAFYEALRNVPEARVRMTGDGPLLSVCKDLASALGIADSVHFAGRQPHEVIQHEMRPAQALVQHSIVAGDGDSEGTPVAILEAGAAGLPMIATRAPGFPMWSKMARLDSGPLT